MSSKLYEHVGEQKLYTNMESTYRMKKLELHCSSPLNSLTFFNALRFQRSNGYLVRWGIIKVINGLSSSDLLHIKSHCVIVDLSFIDESHSESGIFCLCCEKKLFSCPAMQNSLQLRRKPKRNAKIGLEFAWTARLVGARKCVISSIKRGEAMDKKCSVGGRRQSLCSPAQ